MPHISTLTARNSMNVRWNMPDACVPTVPVSYRVVCVLPAYYQKVSVTAPDRMLLKPGRVLIHCVKTGSNRCRIVLHHCARSTSSPSAVTWKYSAVSTVAADSLMPGETIITRRAADFPVGWWRRTMRSSGARRQSRILLTRYYPIRNSAVSILV